MIYYLENRPRFTKIFKLFLQEKTDLARYSQTSILSSIEHQEAQYPDWTYFVLTKKLYFIFKADLINTNIIWI